MASSYNYQCIKSGCRQVHYGIVPFCPYCGARQLAEVKPESKPELTQAVKLEEKSEEKPEIKPEVKSEAKPEVISKVKPEVKPERLDQEKIRELVAKIRTLQKSDLLRRAGWRYWYLSRWVGIVSAVLPAVGLFEAIRLVESEEFKSLGMGSAISPGAHGMPNPNFLNLALFSASTLFVVVLLVKLLRISVRKDLERALPEFNDSYLTPVDPSGLKFFRKEEGVQGPYSAEQFRALFRKGSIDLMTLSMGSGMQDWRPPALIGGALDSGPLHRRRLLRLAATVAGQKRVPLIAGYRRGFTKALNELNAISVASAKEESLQRHSLLLSNIVLATGVSIMVGGFAFGVIRSEYFIQDAAPFSSITSDSDPKKVSRPKPAPVKAVRTPAIKSDTKAPHYSSGVPKSSSETRVPSQGGPQVTVDNQSQPYNSQPQSYNAQSQSYNSGSSAPPVQSRSSSAGAAANTPQPYYPGSPAPFVQSKPSASNATANTPQPYYPGSPAPFPQSKPVDTSANQKPQQQDGGAVKDQLKKSWLDN